uniref:Uncharacterized protein n=1 Tax=Knipowitschia caucasica TaxID=637954 RepID=A0AAV2JDJ2_KNICA
MPCISVGGSNPRHIQLFQHSVHGQTLRCPPRSSHILFLAHYKVPSAASLPAPRSLKVTANDVASCCSFDRKHEVQR